MTPKQRLQTLANFLRTVPPEKFDLWDWRSAPPPPSPTKASQTHPAGPQAAPWARAQPTLPSRPGASPSALKSTRPLMAALPGSRQSLLWLVTCRLHPYHLTRTT